MSPPLSPARDQQLALLLSELTDRMHRGEQIDFASVCRQHPEFEADLKSLWGTIMVANAVGQHTRTSAEKTDSAGGPGKISLPLAFGDYQLLEELGSGGMGVVYLAAQSELHREVAIKMILPSRLSSDTDRQRFFTEARATAQLEHPGIVPVYDVGEIDKRPYFSMQYVKGHTLSERVAHGPIPQRETARIMSQVARAVDFAHQHGILHRDIKPSNILLDETGRAKLTDFGLAKFLDNQESFTNTGAILGTPTYMSPEQASGRNVPLGPASDVYSIGTVLYFVLTGTPPFVATSPVNLALQIMEQEPVPLRAIDPKIDRDLEMIVVKCLQKPPDLRYSSAGSLADDLDAFLRDEPVTARSGQLAQMVARVFRETHHAPILENWGLLWMWHSLVLLIACLLTEAIQLSGTQQRWPYAALWIVGLGAWAAVFWALRRRMGPVTFVERQIAHVWGASMIAIAMLFPMEWWLKLPPLTLSPLLGIISGMVFVVKAGILSGAFYAQAACLFIASWLMAIFPWQAHLIFGVVSAGCFFFPGLKYFRQSREP